MKQFFYLLAFILTIGCASANAQNYKTHKVKAGETIEEIAKLYNVTPFDIYTLNPDAKKGLKRNAVLIIPKSKISTSTPQAAITKELSGFKEYKVKRKETLYSISKKFDIEQEDIKKHNPFLYADNLRKGDRLKIPVYKRVLEVKEPESTTQQYTVLPKEGKWRIAYKYGITVAELEALNPGMAEVLNPGDKINVPNIKAADQKEVDNQYSYYEVLPKEGFYRLKLKLGLEQEELEALNPELKESGLKVGMVLKIPYSEGVDAASSGLEEVNLGHSINTRETKRIAIMLPFKLNKIDIDSVADTKALMKKDPFLKMSMDFYSGAIVALDSLEKMGASLKIDVYDTKNLASEVSSILNDNDFEEVSAVIGPFMPNNVERVASELRKHNIPVVSPITKNVTLSENVFQSRPSEDLLYDKIVNSIKQDDSIDQIIIIADNDHVKVSDNLKREFPSAPQVYSRKDKEGEEAYFIYDDDILPKLKPGKNVVFLETLSPGLVSNVSSKLNAFITKERQIILVTTNMNDAFEDDEVSNYHLSNLQLEFAAIAKMYNEDDANSFAKNYVNRFGVTPNKVAVRGFDITMDVILRVLNYENLYESVNQAPLTAYVENKFAYKKKFMGGYYNNSVYLVKYQDLKIVEIQDTAENQD
ncbi:peptidoglycan-binding protein [Hanstruepera neustonica]|uniref:Peptidoglycan-binding protein n=1 Tax=Hanstruepera neustonica TaxID=1445657 RepID=A0A2K1E037_9FLAO|nr:LysM peptidoglycan-binding domain-containing protein [Hanstruepera neustonica]PNQ73635.1 peptidoglycan-binding protein [Hanstruepera neustonica]